jgi:hypothetical protein
MTVLQFQLQSRVGAKTALYLQISGVQLDAHQVEFDGRIERASQRAGQIVPRSLPRRSLQEFRPWIAERRAPENEDFTAFQGLLQPVQHAQRVHLVIHLGAQREDPPLPALRHDTSGRFRPSGSAPATRFHSDQEGPGVQQRSDPWCAFEFHGSQEGGKEPADAGVLPAQGFRSGVGILTRQRLDRTRGLTEASFSDQREHRSADVQIGGGSVQQDAHRVLQYQRGLIEIFQGAQPVLLALHLTLQSQ